MTGLRWQVPGTASRALLGGVAWMGMVLAAQGGNVPIGLIEGLFLLAPLVIVPLGFLLTEVSCQRRGDPSTHRRARRLEPIAAFLVVVSFWLTPGVLAGSLTLPWLLVVGLAGLSRLHGRLRSGFGPVEAVCVDAGWTIVTNDLIWWVPFFLILRRAYRVRSQDG